MGGGGGDEGEAVGDGLPHAVAPRLPSWLKEVTHGVFAEADACPEGEPADAAGLWDGPENALTCAEGTQPLISQARPTIKAMYACVDQQLKQHESIAYLQEGMRGAGRSR